MDYLHPEMGWVGSMDHIFVPLKSCILSGPLDNYCARIHNTYRNPSPDTEQLESIFPLCNDPSQQFELLNLILPYFHQFFSFA